jgi:hypothetical protein
MSEPTPMHRVGEISALSDGSAATLISTDGTETQAALDARVEVKTESSIEGILGAPLGAAALDEEGLLERPQMPGEFKTRSGRKPAGDRDNIFHLEDFGVRGNDVDADTRGLHDAVAAAAPVRGHVALPTHLGAPLLLGDTLDIPQMTVFGNHSAGRYRFGPGATSSDKVQATTVIRRPAGMTHDLLRTTGSGSKIQNVTLHGGGTAGRGLYLERGFEVDLENVRLSYFDDTALDVAESCNALWSGISIDNSGNVTHPAMVLNPRNGRTINTITALFLQIERCYGIYLDVGPDITTSIAEYIRLIAAHFEAVTDNDGIENTFPLLRWNNARQGSISQSIFYGGPSHLIEYNRTRTNILSATVGLTIGMSSIFGRNTETGLQPEHLIKAVKGDGLVLLGNNFDNCVLEPVVVESTFGATVETAANMLTERAATGAGRRLMADQRTVRRPTTFPGDVEILGSLAGLQPAGSSPLITGRWYHGIGPGVPTAAIPPEGAMRGARFVCGRTTNIAAIGINVTVAGSAEARIRLGIYELNTTTGAATLLLDAGTVDGSTTGFKEIATAPLLTAGKTYLLAAAVQGGAATRPTLQVHTGSDPFWGDSTATTMSASALGGAGIFGITTGFPASPALSTAGSGTVPRVLVRA